MKSIEALFREYLRTYHDGLNSIADILTNAYLGKGESRETRLLSGLEKYVTLNEEFVDELKARKSGDYNRAQRNLLNSWYNECALRHPSDDSKFKFAIWKMIQFYYTIYTGLSSLGRLIYKKRWGHIDAIDIFVDELLCARARENLRARFFLTLLSGVECKGLPYTQNHIWFYLEMAKIPRYLVYLGGLLLSILVCKGPLGLGNARARNE